MTTLFRKKHSEITLLDLARDSVTSLFNNKQVNVFHKNFLTKKHDKSKLYLERLSLPRTVTSLSFIERFTIQSSPPHVSCHRRAASLGLSSQCLIPLYVS